MAGYSGTPLGKKLGIKESSVVLALGAPPGFEEALGPLPVGARLVRALPQRGELDVAVAFVDQAKKLTPTIIKLKARLAQAGGLWIGWPKKASGVATDVTEDLVREIGLGLGLVDNKVCAIDETWSGLRLVIRLKDRR